MFLKKKKKVFVLVKKDQAEQGMCLCSRCFSLLALGKIKLERKKGRLVSNHSGSLGMSALLLPPASPVPRTEVFVRVSKGWRRFLSKTNLEGQGGR